MDVVVLHEPLEQRAESKTQTIGGAFGKMVWNEGRLCARPSSTGSLERCLNRDLDLPCRAFVACNLAELRRSHVCAIIVGQRTE